MYARVVLFATWLLAACGGGGHDAFFDRTRDLCSAITPGTTLGDLVPRFGVDPVHTSADCKLDYLPVASGDTCPYGPSQTICVYEFTFFSSDDRACRGTGGGGRACGYGCAVRTAGQAPPDGHIPVCAHEFLTGQ